jgi:hypothetical protein
MIGNLSPDPKAEPRVYAADSDEGFLLFDIRGTQRAHQPWPEPGGR